MGGREKGRERRREIGRESERKMEGERERDREGRWEGGGIELGNISQALITDLISAIFVLWIFKFYF